MPRDPPEWFSDLTANISEGDVMSMSAFVIGSMRTMQQDVEFGVLQIVDIALKAISPAVNDPSTAINCVDQLARILIRWVGRAPPANLLSDPPHVVRVIIPWIDFDHLLDTAFEQIRHYAVNDIAVSLRLLRALSDLAATTDDEPMCERLVLRGRRIVAGCATWVDASNSKRLERRLAELEARAPTPGDPLRQRVIPARKIDEPRKFMSFRLENRGACVGVDCCLYFLA